MKRRNRNGHQRFTPRKSLRSLAERGARKRKSWSFERLEDRLVFSVQPVQFQTVSFSNDTPEGAIATYLDELNWAAMQQANVTGTAPHQFVAMALPTDPMFPQQWHLLNVGQEVGNPDLQNLFGVAGEDINLFPPGSSGLNSPWDLVDSNGDAITGKGILVAVIDTGVQQTHPDLIANLSPTLHFNASTGTTNSSPSLVNPEGFHGTAVAGLIGAVMNNGIGGTGVAPGVTIVPIKVGLSQFDPGTIDQFVNAFNYALQHSVSITNNSYGPDHQFDRNTLALLPEEVQALRNSVIFGRGGLGMINVFSSGNDAGPGVAPGFTNVGNYDSSSYNAFANSRYVITVTGVDHDGMYINADGTFTDYANAGPNVLVAAPTGSNGALTIADDNGYGSGIWTTDLVGDFGANAAPLPNGFDPDNDPWPDPNFTSRFNGTSASAPIVSGVIALMLQANPNLTYRDVQEILVRSARQNAEFETPSSGSLLGPRTTWQVNQIHPFQDPDPWDNSFLYPLPILENPFDALYNPLADPGVDPFTAFFQFDNIAPDGNDVGRQEFSHYEPEPALYTNGAGFTVSQGYGAYAEQTGFGHGVVDAALAVSMARQWNTLGQNLAPSTERTFTTSVVSYVGGSSVGGLNIPAAEKMPDNLGGLIVPGGLGGLAGFINYWNEFFKPVTFDATTGLPDPTTGPFSEQQPPVNTRGGSYIDFSVPPPQAMSVEWVEVKLSMTGPANDLDFMKLNLTSPEGTQTEFTEYTASPAFSGVISFQDLSTPGNAGNSVWLVDAAGDIGNGAGGTQFVWTFNTNRNWGESTNAATVIDPTVGEPATIDDFFTGLPIAPVFRNWEFHIENWSQAAFQLSGIEVVWHGKPIAGSTLDPNYSLNGIPSAQRVQGFVGIDTNGDELFNFSRSLQTNFDTDFDPATVRMLDIEHQQDFNDTNFNGAHDAGEKINQEPFAANIVVDAYRVWNGVPESTPTARFLTGDDGNYYFDLNVQGDLAETTNPLSPHFGQTIEYEIRASDPMSRPKLEDVATPLLPTSNPLFTYLPHYKQVWRINPDWFYAPDRDNPLTPGNNPGEIFFDATGASSTLNGLPVPGAPAPVPFTADQNIPAVPMVVKNLNFLLKQDAPPEQFDVTGTVYSDVNANGQFDGNDAVISGAFVYWDKDRNGAHDAGEPTAVTNAVGQYTLTIDLTMVNPVPTGSATYQVGVIKPSGDWMFTDPGHDGVETVFAGPGSPPQLVNFFLQPPNAAPPGGNGPGTIQGIVFNDLNTSGIQDVDEAGVPNFRVFIDANQDGIWQSATEVSTLTASNGSYFFANVIPGVYRIDIVIPNEGAPNAQWSLTSPILGYRDVQVFAGGSVTGANFGLRNLADHDWGDLPDSFKTLAISNGPSHQVVAGFKLGATLDGEADGLPSPNASSDVDDDGVSVVSNSGVLTSGVNTLRVTVSGVGGLLTGWMDFNNDGHFDVSERLTWTLNGNSLGGEADINPGTYDLQVTIPPTLLKSPIAARFRWGERGLSFTGPAIIGEVEDYFFNLNYVLGDYNRNGVVDQADYVVWQNTLGQAAIPAFSGADGNGNGVIDQGDYDVWRSHYGAMVPVPGAGAGLAAEEASPSAPSAGAAVIAESSSLVQSSSSAATGWQYIATPRPPATPPTTPSLGSVVVGTNVSIDIPASPVVSTGDSSLSSSPLFGVLATDTTLPIGFTSSSTTVVQQAATTTTLAPSDLLLLDQAWTDLDGTSYDHDDESLYSEQTHDGESANDLALAAVLSEDEDWWGAI